MPHFLTLARVEDILGMLSRFSPVPAESVALEDAWDRVLAAPCAARENVPGFDRSTMDGFAVRARDVFGASEGMPALLDCVGECPMGEVPALAVGPGQTARIWTGGMLPPGADAVVMLEYARPAGTDQVELTRPVAPGENTILEGEDVAAGEELLPAGTRLRPQDLGLLAALGTVTVQVHRRPRVTIISTGDEVVPADRLPGPGQVRDINSHTLAALVRSCGGRAHCTGVVGDDRDRLRDLLLRERDRADAILLSGGSSAGRRDYSLRVLADLPGAHVLVHGAAISPGKPLILADVRGTAVWGLPGHAAGALVCAEVFIRPMLQRLLGMPVRPPAWEGRVRARMSRPVASVHGRRDYIRVSLVSPERPDEPLQAVPVLGKSGLISTLVRADALVVCPEDREGLDAGELVPVRFFA